MSKHQKLSQCQKVASRFTEIVVKTHENVSVVSSYLSGYLSTSWIGLITVFDAILTGRQSGPKLQCLYGNSLANNFFQN